MVGAPHLVILGQGLVPGFQVEMTQQPSSPLYCRPYAGTQEATQERKTPHLGPSCVISPRHALLSMSSLKCKQT